MRYLEFGKITTEWANFTVREIIGRSQIVDSYADNTELSANTAPATIGPFFGPVSRSNDMFEIDLETIRSLIGPAPILFSAQMAFYSYTPNDPVGGTMYAYRLLTAPDYTDATYRYSTFSTLATWYGDAYGVFLGQDAVLTPFDTVAYTGTSGVVASAPDNFIDVLSPLRWSLLRGLDLQFIIKTAYNASTHSGSLKMNWTAVAQRPHLQLYYLFPVEFFQSTYTGDIDMTSMVDNASEDNLYYLGAMEAGDTGAATLGFIKNFSPATLSHLEILDDHPEWTSPVNSVVAGTGRMDYVSLADSALSQKYTIVFTSSSAFDVTAEAYRDYVISLNAAGGGAGWTGTTGGDFVAPSGGLTIPEEAWQPGTLVNDEFTFYVRGNSTETDWPADSNDQIYITSDSAGSPVTADWRPITGRRTRSTASVTIDATTKKIPVRAIDSTLWIVGNRAFIADVTNMNEGDIVSAQEASIGAATQSVGSGLDDCTMSGNYYGVTEHTVAGSDEYGLKISTAAATDKFQWTDDGGSTWSAEISMTGAAQQLGSTDIYVTWAATTGHVLSDEWTIDVSPFMVEIESLTANSNVYAAGAKVGTSLPIRDTAAAVWGLSTAAAGVSEVVKNRVYVEGQYPDFADPTTAGFQVADSVFVRDVTNEDVYEYATIQTLGGTYIDLDSNLANDYPEGSLLAVRGSGEAKFHLRVIADPGTLEELKEARLNVRL